MVTLRNIAYNSVTVSLPKNVIQYSLGFVLYWLLFGSFDMITLALSLSGFLLAYSAVYMLNDIIDCREDMEDGDKREWKLLACGVMRKRSAYVIGILMAASGLILSSLVNVWFLLIIVVLLFLNFLHSSPYTRLKKRIVATTVNMTAIEFLKYSTGWFAFTANLAFFPFWIVLTFSLVYAGIYLVYKFRFKGNIIREKKYLLGAIALLTVVSYGLSMILYSFTLPLIILLVATFALLGFSLKAGKKFKFMNWLWLELIILPLVIVAFLLLSIPFVETVNDELTDTIGEYKETVYKELPEDVVTGIENLSKPAYESLDEIQDEVLNITINLSNISLPQS